MTGGDIRTLADLPERIQERLLAGEAEPVFQLLPPLAERDRDTLRESVATRGIRVPVELDPEGRVLDGHHRIEVAAELELDPGEIPVTVRDDLQGEEDILEYVLEVNLGRRHLTKEERQQIAAKLRARGWSYPRIADRLRISVGTAHGDVQAFKSENLDEGDHLPETVEGADGKTYPARQARTDGATSSVRGAGGSGRRRPPGRAQGQGEGVAAGSRIRSGGRRGRKRAPTTSAGSDRGPEEGDPFLAALDRLDEAFREAMNTARTGEQRVELRRGRADVRKLRERVVGPGRAVDPVERSGPTLRQRAGEAWEEILEAVGNEAEAFVERQLPAPARRALEQVGGWERIEKLVDEGRERRRRRLRIQFVATFAEAAGREDDPGEVVL